MGVSFHKSKKIAPGVCLTVNKKGISASVGNKLAEYLKVCLAERQGAQAFPVRESRGAS